MYGWLWRALPGSAALRVLQLAVLAAAVLALLAFVVFPWVERETNPGTVGGGGAVPVVSGPVVSGPVVSGPVVSGSPTGR